MSKLLLDEHPLTILPSLAVKIGLNEAIFIQQLHYWLEISKKKEAKEKEKTRLKKGKFWSYNTYDELMEQFPFWSVKTIKRIVKGLKESEILLVENFNKDKWNKTNWYSINYQKLESLLSKNGAESEDKTIPPNGSTDGDNMTLSDGDNMTLSDGDNMTLSYNENFLTETSTETSTETIKNNIKNPTSFKVFILDLQNSSDRSYLIKYSTECEKLFLENTDKAEIIKKNYLSHQKFKKDYSNTFLNFLKSYKVLVGDLQAKEKKANKPSNLDLSGKDYGQGGIIQ